MKRPLLGFAASVWFPFTGTARIELQTSDTGPARKSQSIYLDTMRKSAPLMLCLVSLWASAAKAEEHSPADYGIESPVINDDESEADKAYGGFPNNAFFNNDTPCEKVVSLFDKPDVNPSDIEMFEYKRYSSFKLMEAEIITSRLEKQTPAIEIINKATWIVLPVLVPTYCKSHPGSPLGHVLTVIYLSARQQALGFSSGD